ncbi:hypothetical protein CTI12_AA029720 [Artemisia annua]|uniref:DUF659 domain-containing protein n=1 Tax=Artemisia annua TaxID=35608 RepID=A0A2U1QDD3_ARTAN|nr:hypothetical protein CTI12_AA029720 [Artemisia annua]
MAVKSDLAVNIRHLGGQTFCLDLKKGENWKHIFSFSLGLEVLLFAHTITPTTLLIHHSPPRLHHPTTPPLATPSGDWWHLDQLVHHPFSQSLPGQVTSCPRATKDDQVRCRDAIYEGKLKKQGKQQHNEAIRSEVRIDIESDDEGTKSSMKEPNIFGPMDKVNPEESLKRGKGAKGKSVDLSNAIRKERMWMAKKYIGMWAYEAAIPFHAFERDSFKLLLEVVGQFGPGLPPPTRYELSTPILKEEVERTKKSVKRNKEQWKEEGCSNMTDAWTNRKRRSIMNLCVNSRMGTVFLSSKECSSQAHTSIGALSRFKKILDQAKKLTIFIYSHHKTLAMMRSFTKKRDIVRPGVTRFASSFLTLQSLNEKKEELRHMFSSTEWEECRFFNTVKGRTAYATVLSTTFWTGVTLCLKVFSALVKVLRMVDADWKPSMGFVYGELIKAKEEIKGVMGGNNNKKTYESIVKIIDTKMKGRLDSPLHVMVYLLNPYYFYKDTEIQHVPELSEKVLQFFETILDGDLAMQKQVTLVELPKHKSKMDRFGKELAVSSC